MDDKRMTAAILFVAAAVFIVGVVAAMVLIEVFARIGL